MSRVGCLLPCSLWQDLCSFGGYRAVFTCIAYNSVIAGCTCILWSTCTFLLALTRCRIKNLRHWSNPRRGAGGPEAQNSVCEAGDSCLPRPLLCPLPTSTHHKQEGQYHIFLIVLSIYGICPFCRFFGFTLRVLIWIKILSLHENLNLCIFLWLSEIVSLL